LKVTREMAQKNRDLVIDTAARLLRERGPQGTSLADIMTAAGLTHGGFYRNFASKEDLARQAGLHAAASMKAAVLAGLKESPNPLHSLIETYVSRAHRDNPGAGCILPALATDAARSDDPHLRALFTTVIRDYLDQLADLASRLPGGVESDAPVRRHPAALLSEMVGAVILSRVVTDGDIADLLIAAVTADIVGSPGEA
jgi:TetR/AcrR family transcriptional repressor of nem operon